MEYTEDQLAVLALEAEELLHLQELEEAREIGKVLVEAENEYGFQIMAMAAQEEENVEMAISWLEKGLKLFPGAWALGMQKGNVYSEAGRHKVAVLAYEKASKMPGADTGLIEINKAAAYANAQDFDKALNILQGLKDSDKAIEAFQVKLSLLSNLGKFDLLIEIVDEELAELPIPKDQQQAAIMSEICTDIAKAFWFTDDEEEAVKHYLMQAKEYDRTNVNICWLGREMEPEFSDNSFMFSMIVDGKSIKSIEAIHPETKEKVLVNRFQNNYVAIADSEEEALAYVFAYESDLVEKGSLQIIDVEQVENEEDEPKGLYMLGEMDWMLETS